MFFLKKTNVLKHTHITTKYFTKLLLDLSANFFLISAGRSNFVVDMWLSQIFAKQDNQTGNFDSHKKG
jgi:hypothetical protein